MALQALVTGEPTWVLVVARSSVIVGLVGLSEADDVEPVRLDASDWTALVLRVPDDARLSHDWRLRCALAEARLILPASLRG